MNVTRRGIPQPGDDAYRAARGSLPPVPSGGRRCSGAYFSRTAAGRCDSDSSIAAAGNA